MPGPGFSNTDRFKKETIPNVKAICEKHHAPYIQEPVFRRCKKAIDVMVGRTDMPHQQTRPVSGKLFCERI